jgi:bile acid:Na+ symporter, BASS family
MGTQTSIYRIFLYLSIASFLLALMLGITQYAEMMGVMLLAGFLSAAIGSRGFKLGRGFSFPLLIFAAVTLALTYPKYFVEFNGFPLRTLITPLIQLIMFGMGTAIGIQDFIGVAKMPKGVIIGTLSQFIIMPMVGFTLANLFTFPPEIAAGIILIGCSPAGMASNVMAYLAKANLALSITLTTISTLLAPFVTPFLMSLLAGEFIEVDVLKMMWDIIKMVIIPIGAGLAFNRIFRGKAQWLHNAMPFVSMAGIAFIIVIITAAGRNSLLQIGVLLIISSTIHNTSGFFLGYWSARLFRMAEKDCRTVAIEVGMQNGGLASGIALAMGKMSTVGLAPAVFAPLMNITGSLLASWWHNKPVQDESVSNRAGNLD